MSFRDNLQHLRATRHMTQEQLAMLVGVSRQSVTKWESERAYPEMDKLIKICQIFDCSIDDLVSGDLTAREPEPSQSPAPALADICGYDEHKKGFALRIASGVAVIIIGAAIAALLEGLTPSLADADAGSAIAMLVCVAAGLLLIIPAGVSASSFAKAHPFIEDFYTSEQREKIRHSFAYELSAGIAVIVIMFGLLSALPETRVTVAAFILGIAVGVFLIVHSGILVNRIDVESYNIEALSELNEEEVASIVGEERAPMILAKVRGERMMGSVCGIIMLIATIVGLLTMFYGAYAKDAFLSRYFWIAWMVGGILCAIASLVVKIMGERR